MTENPLVSIILPAFNRAYLLQRSISSVLNQDYKNWELIIVDDFSSDETESVVSTFLHDKRVVYIKNDENLGGSGARNVGLKLAKGEFITFLDSDDEYLPSKISKQVKLFQESEIDNLGVVNCGRHDQRKGVIYNTWIPKFRGDIKIPLLSKDKIGSNTSLLMIRRKILENNILFDPNMPAGQDWDFLIRICLFFNFDFVDKPLVIIHHHDGVRVYNKISSIRAYELQLKKYYHLISADHFVYQKFLIRKALVEFVNGQRGKAKKTIYSYIYKKPILMWLWFYYFTLFQSNRNVLSKIILKVLLLFTFRY